MQDINLKVANTVGYPCDDLNPAPNFYGSIDACEKLIRWLSDPANNVTVNLVLDYEGLWQCELSVNGKPWGKSFNASKMSEALCNAVINV